MMLAGEYGEDWLAAGYATKRPAVHSYVLDRVAELGLLGQRDLVVDVGCGAGVSTNALTRRGAGNHVVGVDPSYAMIREAERHVEEATFLVGRAEALPLRSGQVELMTAAGSLNYVEFSSFFAESRRVLSPEGLLVVYDFGTGRSSTECPGLDSWYSSMVRRWPKPTEGVRHVTRATFESVPMQPVGYETLTASVCFELEDYLDYLMTESNVVAAMRSGIPASAIRAWCEEGLRPLFQHPVAVDFEAYYACLRPTR